MTMMSLRLARVADMTPPGTESESLRLAVAACGPGIRLGLGPSHGHGEVQAAPRFARRRPPPSVRITSQVAVTRDRAVTHVTRPGRPGGPSAGPAARA